MAQKKSGALHVLVIVGVFLIVAYFVLKILPALASRAQSSGSSFGAGGGSVSPYYGDQYGYGYEDQQPGLLGSLLNGLSQLFGGGQKSAGGMKLGGSSAGSGGSGLRSSGSVFGGGGMSLSQILAGFDPYTNQYQGDLANPELGGATLNDFMPTYFDDGFQIPEAPGAIVGDPNQFLNVQDYNPYPFDPSGLDGGGGGDQMPDLGAIFDGGDDDDE